jgi:hypothetical protein
VTYRSEVTRVGEEDTPLAIDVLVEVNVALEEKGWVREKTKTEYQVDKTEWQVE